MNSVCFVAPYKRLAMLARDLIPQFGIPVDIIEGDMQAGLTAAKHRMAQGTRIFLSRGGTSQLLRQELDAHVVDVKFSAVELLSCLRMVVAQRCAVIGFQDLVPVAEKTFSHFNVSPLYLQLKEKQEQADIEQQIRENRIEHIIGDNEGVRIARQYGIPYSLIETGRESIMEAVDRAAEIFRNIDSGDAYNQMISRIFNSIDRDFMLIDRNMKLLRKSTGLPGISGPEELPDECLELIAARKEVNGEAVQIGRNVCSISVFPLFRQKLWDGSLILFQKYEDIINIHSRVRSRIRRGTFTARYHFSHILHESTQMSELIRKAEKYSASAHSVLIMGESGTGKELFAQSIHNASGVASGPFVALNCGVLPANLLESELFGYEAGAFTGAHKDGRPGLFEKAEGGTVFLDEVDSLSLSAQSALLRVLQEKEVIRIGSERVISVNVRVICASNADLQRSVAEKKFRLDLYYRISVLKLLLPGLRDRKEDIKKLFFHFLQQSGNTADHRTLWPEIRDRLLSHSWPGNVRELENVADRYCLTGEIDVDSDLLTETIPPEQQNYHRRFSDIEAEIFRTLYDEEQNISRVAEILDVSRNTVRKKLSLS